MTIESHERWSHAVQGYDAPHLRLRQVAKIIGQLGATKIVDLGCATGHLRQLCPAIALREHDIETVKVASNHVGQAGLVIPSVIPGATGRRNQQDTAGASILVARRVFARDGIVVVGVFH